jgi:hypothetical protein
MGSWNGTCGISKMPIQYGDRVKLVLLKPTKHYRNVSTGSGFCNASDMYTPISLPITGEYNDYGCIENIDEQPELFDLIIEALRIPDRNDIEDIIAGISNEELVDISYMLIHESVYNIMIDITKETPHRYDNNYTTEMHRNDSVDILINYTIEYNKTLNDLRRGILKPLEFDIDYYNNDHYYRILPSVIRKLNDSDILKTIKKDIVDFMIFSEAISDARMFWSPQSGGGSQDLTYEYQIEIGKLAEQLRQKWNDEYDE